MARMEDTIIPASAQGISKHILIASTLLASSASTHHVFQVAILV
jgi:hypothetical protein